MDVNLGLMLGIGVALLAVAGVMGLGLAFLVGIISPLPAKPREEKPAAEVVDERVLQARKGAYRQGIYVLVGLAILTALEYGVAVWFGGSAVFLFVLALAKAGIILQYFMHLGRVWGEEEAHS